MYIKGNKRRYSEEERYDKDKEYRFEFRRDLARVIHSHSFRRLAGKTQLFPHNEMDFFRNRLTHSLEVAQIAKSIALKWNEVNDIKVDLDIVEMAGLAHDIGHPPFGHQGEQTLAKLMKKYGGFEGNAQTLRVLSKLEKKILNLKGYIINGGFDSKGNDKRGGLNLTYRSLASILKYDKNISEAIEEDKLDECKRKINDPKNFKPSEKYVFKGYYDTEQQIVDFIKKNVNSRKAVNKFKTIECKIMDIADDIAYSTYDLEDAFKAGFMSPLDMLTQSKSFYIEIAEEINETIKDSSDIEDVYELNSFLIEDIISDLFKTLFDLPQDWKDDLKNTDYQTNSEEYTFLGSQYSKRYSALLSKNGYVRSDFSSQLVTECINNLTFKVNSENPEFSDIRLAPKDWIRIEILKRFSFKTQILSPKLKAHELRGAMIIEDIFNVLNPVNNGDVPDLLPDDFKLIYKQNDCINHKYRTICDFIACMTDRYAIEFHGRIKSEKPSSIFKRI